MAWHQRLWNALRPGRLQRDLDRELSFHIAEQMDELKASGLSPAEALRRAHVRFGSFSGQMERTREMDINSWLDSTIRNLTYAVCALRKSPAFTLTVVLTLALGIGATAAVFSLIQGVLLTPPPYRQPQQLVLVNATRTDGQKVASPRNWPAVQWMEWQKEAKSLDGIAAYAWTFNFLVSPEGSESIEGMVVTRDYFRVTGLQPMLGRVFSESETRPGPAQVIVLGHEFWQRRFNGDPKIIGKTLRISRRDTPPTVIGIMPPGVRFLPSPTNSQEPNYNVNALVDFWVPVTPDPARLKRPDWDVVARLQEGATLQQA